MDPKKPGEPVVATPLRTLSYVRRAPDTPLSPSQIYLATYQGFLGGTILCWLILIPIVHRGHLSFHIITLGAPAFTIVSSTTLWIVQRLLGCPYPEQPRARLWYSVIGGFLNNLLSVVLVAGLIIYIVPYNGVSDPTAPVLTATAAIAFISTFAAVFLLPKPRMKSPVRRV